jgi:tetratricopeptide (TPR) repeat protein
MPTTRIAVAFLCLITFAIFGRSLRFDFLSLDDDIHVTDNRLMRKPVGEAVATVWRAPYQGLYIPVSYTAWRLTEALGESLIEGPIERRAPLYHALNLLLHLASAVLVFALLQSLFDSTWASLLGAALFAWHPLQAESVAWVTGQRDVLSGFFALLGLWRCAVAIGERRAPRVGEGIFISLCFLLGILSKPGVVVAPVLALCLAWGVGFWNRRLTGWMAVWLALSVLASLPTVLSQSQSLGFPVPGWGGRVLVAADALGLHVRHLFWPVQLAPDYGRMPSRVLEDAGRFMRLLWPALFLALCYRWRARRWVVGSLLAFATSLAPVSGMVPFIHQAFSTVADRYAYLALLAPALGLAAWMRGASPAARGAMSALLLLLVPLASRQVSYWRDNRSLYTHAVEVNPASWGAHLNLGEELEKQGDEAGAIREFSSALRLQPDNPGTFFNLAHLLVRQDRLDEALKVFPTSNRYAGYAKYDQMVKYFWKRRKADPSPGAAYQALGKVMAFQGLYPEARKLFEASLRERPTAEAYLDRGYAEMAMGEDSEAARSWREALRMDPTSQLARDALASVK